MHAVTPEPEAPTTSGSHYQMFLFGRPPMVHWRLLSGNNRDMCRSRDSYPDVETCTSAISRFIATLESLSAQVKRDENGDWTWVLTERGVPVAEAGHAYDRKIRCDRAIAQVLKAASTAPLRPQLVISGHRRWQANSRIMTSPEPIGRQGRQLS